jgi:thiol-disulfide isomerase/thioredoxin
MNRSGEWLRKNWFNAIMVGLIAVLWLVPDAKALLIRGLMRVGLFQPAIETSNGKELTRDIVPDAIFEDASGKTLSLSQLHGKVVVLNFWATWCPPCIAEMPSLDKLYRSQTSRPDIFFLTVDADGDFQRAAAFMQKHGYSLPIYRLHGSVSEKVFSGTLPTTVVLDKTGRIAFRETGAANYDAPAFRSWLEKLAAE